MPGGCEVALKVLRPARAANPRIRARFQREGRLAATVDHPHVVKVFAVGDQGGLPFLVLELLQGETLETRLRREGRLPVSEVLRVGQQAADGLAAAHAAGLVHRDVKPANLWLEAPTGRVKLLDFGLARAAAESQTLTEWGDLTGTPAYMAPEQTDEPSVARHATVCRGKRLWHIIYYALS